MRSNDLRAELLKNIIYDIKSDVKALNSKMVKNKSRVLKHLENMVDYMENVILSFSEDDNYNSYTSAQEDDNYSSYIFAQEDNDSLNQENLNKQSDNANINEKANDNENGSDNGEEAQPENNTTNDEEKTNEIKYMTLNELAKYNGLNGMPAYVEVEGIIYDVTNSPLWAEGLHFGAMAGRSLTIDYQACHAQRPTLSRMPVVGKIKIDIQP